MKKNETIPILLDTDIGSDIDDAVALAYLLRQPRCELVGISTVSGDVARRAACAQVICREMGREDIPIVAGASDPLVSGSAHTDVPQYDAIRDLPHTLDHRPNQAVEFLRSTIHRNPGRLTLLSIGPFTNIALLFAIDPEIPQLLKGFISMAGSFFEPMRQHVPAEYNVRADPVASAISYNRRHALPTPQVSVGLDVTGQCILDAAVVRRKFAARPLNVALRMAEVWFARMPNIAFHDPLAAALVFRPDLCTYVEGEITVPLGAVPARQSQFSPVAGGRHRVAASVNAAAFFEHFFDVCS